LYVIGDIHSNYKALKQVINKLGLNGKEEIVFIGDLCEGIANECDKCLELLMEFENLTPIIGNHDIFLKDWYETNMYKKIWLKMGGGVTMDCFNSNKKAKDLLDGYFLKSKYYHVIEDKFFCHAGFNQKRLINKQKNIKFCTDRTLYEKVGNFKTPIQIKMNEKNDVPIKDIFIGHTPTKNKKPDFVQNLINIDTGAGNIGKLTMMNIYTKEYWQSKTTDKLYNL
jgi:serine/threonine protein phosphatase 1